MAGDMNAAQNAVEECFRLRGRCGSNVMQGRSARLRSVEYGRAGIRIKCRQRCDTSKSKHFFLCALCHELQSI
jgi:hypothetical protein